MTDTNRGVRYILIAIALVALALVIWQTLHVLVVIFGGVVAAAVVRGLAVPISRRFGWSEKWTVGLVAVLLAAAFVLLCWLFGRQISTEATEMRRLVPASLDQVSKYLESSSLGHAAMDRVRSALDDSSILSHLGLAAGAVLYVIGDAILIFFLGIYFALSPLDYLEGFLRLIPPARRATVRAAMVDAGGSLLKWLLAQLCAMVAVGLLVGIGLAVLHVPLALLLGVLAGLLEFIPAVGAIIFTIPGVLIAFTQGPQHAFYVLLFYVAVQQCESNLLLPLLQRWAVRLPPAITLVSVVIGGILLGGIGVVFATPLAVVTLVLARHLYVEQALEHARTPRPRAAGK